MNESKEGWRKGWKDEFRIFLFSFYAKSPLKIFFLYGLVLSQALVCNHENQMYFSVLCSFCCGSFSDLVNKGGKKHFVNIFLFFSRANRRLALEGLVTPALNMNYLIIFSHCGA